MTHIFGFSPYILSFRMAMLGVVALSRNEEV